MKRFRQYLPFILVIILFLIAFFVWQSLGKGKGSNIMKVAFLDIGQGDAIYIEAPNGKQMLIDAGTGPIVLPQLAKVMPFGDRSIDMLIVTNPDMDHMGGFVDVLESYAVGQILEPGTPKDTLIYKKLQQSIVDKGVKKVIARRGMHIVLDSEKNVYLDILFPDRDVSTWSPNDGSIVGRLVYGEQSFMLMGDASKFTELLVKQNEDPLTLQSDVLKVGHHGSRTSSSELWLGVIDPDLAVISAGRSNRYNHPHQDILNRLKSFNIPYIGTFQNGTIIMKTDGVSLSY
jgi:competence protein ComEC